ncbi:MAG: PspC domain-containing protein [Chitinophagaceae bacterium]|nr:MAG: PspC domain-containing protein [Chitinophagaceae bacterium]
MKKIININLSGRVVPIEDSAYERLQGYIESLRRYFASEEGRDEIINDIESRIAELMNEKVRKGAEAITDTDINEIMSSMGRPEDFEAEAAATPVTPQPSSSAHTSANTSYTQTETKKTRGRLHRDSSDKIIGGVCSGIAYYLNIDPAIFRLLFAIITFGGFGLGILLYIILWIILPAKDLEGYSGKRLYRNPEDRIIGGVGSGLAAYFNKETWVVRLIFVAPILLNIILNALSWPFFHEGVIFPNIVFGSLSGTFVLAYIILWIVLPEAKSEYQKMEMRGEKVDVNTIRQTVQDRTKEFGEEIKSAATNFSQKAKEFSNTKGKAFASEVGEVARRTGVGLGHVIGVIFKAFFFLVAGSIAFGLFVALLALIFGGVGFWPLKNYVLNGFWQNAFAWGTLLFFLGIPLVAFITWLIRRIMKVKSQNNYLGWTFGGLWALGWVSVCLLVASIMKDIRYYERTEEPVSIVQPVNGKIIVKVNEAEIRYSGTWWWINMDDHNGFDIDRDSLRMANIKLRVTKSEDSNYHIKVWRYSAGTDRRDAEERAKKIRFNSSYSDSVLNLGSGLVIDQGSKFRGQRVMVEIQVPVGKKIKFDKSLDEMYHPINIRVYDQSQRGWRRSWGGRRDFEFEWDWDEYFDWETNIDYTMGADGNLVNPAKPAKKDESNYRYQNDQEQTDRENRKKELEDELKKIKEQEKTDSLIKKSNGIKQESMDDNDETVSGSADLTGFSLAWYIN